MQQITIGTKNQIVIPLEVRNQITGLKPGRKVMVYKLDAETVVIRVPQKNWLERSFGALKGILPLDAAEQVTLERGQWDAR